MRVYCLRAVPISLAVAFLVLIETGGDLHGQAPAKINVRFKVFDSNNPSKRLKPVNAANNFVRDPVTKKAEFLESVAITRKDPDALDELTVSKGWLIERLVIQVDDPNQDYNPAIVTKVVSAADMTLYPGASRSTDVFAFQAYQAQMTAYRTLLSELLEEIDPSRRNKVRDDFRTAFQKQLVNMGDIAARLPNAKLNEVKAAKKLRDDVFKLYGLATPEAFEPSEPPTCKVYERQIDECCSNPRRRFFGRWRR